MVARCLLVLACGFAAISSSTAAALGLEEERVTVFSGLVALLLLVPYLKRPRLEQPDGLVVALLLLLPVIAAHDALSGRLDPVDYKVALPILVLLAAPNLTRELGRERVVPLAWWLLSAYVAGTFAYRLVAEPAAVARGYGGIVRYDPTGSVVMHASLSVIHLLVALAKAASAIRPAERVLALALGSLALVMALQSATRTVVVTLALFACFAAATARDRGATLTRLAAAGLGLGLVFLAYSLAWDPSFLLRLTTPAEEGDYGSGRLPSVAYWLGLAGERPFGLGFGAVREMLAEGKPWLDGASTLEWPHNEFVRLYVEAGPLGLGFALLLVGALVRTGLRAAAQDPGGDPVRRTLMLAIAADVVAEACLQNLFNAVHHATVLVVFLALAAAATRGSGRAPAPATNRPGQVPALAPT